MTEAPQSGAGRFSAATFTEQFSRCDVAYEEYVELREHIDFLNDIALVEECFSMIFSNLLQFENILATICLRAMIFNPADYNITHDQRLAVDTALLNTMAAIRAYVDRPTRLFRRPAIFDFDESKSRQYDAHVEYRIMEALRNFSQHKGPGLTSITLHMRNETVLGQEKLLYAISLTMNPEVAEGAKLRRTDPTLIGQKIQLLPALRKYISCLTEMHGEFRGAVDEPLEESRAFFDTKMIDFQRRMHLKKNISYVELFEETEVARTKKGTFFLEQFQRIKHLRRTAGHPRYEEAVFVSNVRSEDWA